MCGLRAEKLFEDTTAIKCWMARDTRSDERTRQKTLCNSQQPATNELKSTLQDINILARNVQVHNIWIDPDNRGNWGRVLEATEGRI